jgi:TonB family protein
VTTIVLQLASLSAKIILLGGIAWLQLFLLRRAPASSRSRLCSVALIAMLLLGAGEMFAPHWMVKTPLFTFAAASGHGASPSVTRAAARSWVTILWMTGAAILLLRAISGRMTLAILRRRSRSLDLVSGVEIRIGAVQTPVLFGLLRPTILLPEAARTWTEEQRCMVLTHELTHFRQGDIGTNLLAQGVRALLWFHPVVWLLVSRLSKEQELTCDEAVIASGYSRHDYAAFLLDSVRRLTSGQMVACAMAGSGARSLQERFANLLDPRPESTRRPVLRRHIVLSLALFSLIAIALTVVRPVWPQSESKSQGELYTTPTVYKAGGDVSQPSVLTKVEPKYTEEARKLKISGPVFVRLVVTAEGKPDNIEVTDGIGYGLDESAVDAISQWRFQPATKDGKAVAVWATVQVNYRLL